MEKEKPVEYTILIDSKPIATGRNLKKMIEEVEKRYPRKKITIRCKYPPGILIAILQL
jgi:hypothetical protein